MERLPTPQRNNIIKYVHVCVESYLRYHKAEKLVVVRAEWGDICSVVSSVMKLGHMLWDDI